MKCPHSVSRFVRLAEKDRPRVCFTIDGEQAIALAGDTVLTAVLTNGRIVRRSEFGDEPRSGFCLMGACQDCWIWTSSRERLRGCSTPIAEGMALCIANPPSDWSEIQDIGE